MKLSLTVFGVVLILLGVLGLAYQGVSYTQQEEVARVGSVQVSAEKEKNVYFPPALGGLALVAGIVLVAVGRKSGNGPSL